MSTDGRGDLTIEELGGFGLLKLLPMKGGVLVSTNRNFLLTEADIARLHEWSAPGGEPSIPAEEVDGV